MEFEFNLDTEFDFNREKNLNETSEVYNEKVRIFLEELKIFKINSIKKKTFKIINSTITDLRCPEINEQLRIRTQQQINLISIILKIIENDKIIDSLIIATYTLNKEAFDILLSLKKTNKISKIKLMIASSYEFRNKKHKQYLIDKCIDNDISLLFLWIHFKITLVNCGINYYHFEGSMNYSTNNMAEQLLFENNKEIYEKDMQFFDEIVKNANNSLEIIN